MTGPEPFFARRPIRQAAVLLSLAAGLCGTAQAQSTDAVSGLARQDLEIVGTSPPNCLIQPGATAQGSNATFFADSASGGSIAINQLADSTTSRSNAMAIQVELPMICNTAHTVVLRSRNGGMLRIGGSRQAVRGFAEFLPYRVSSNWAGFNSTGRSDDSQSLQFNIPNGGQGLLTVDLAIEPGSMPLVAGGYEDTLQIEVAATH